MPNEQRKSSKAQNFRAKYGIFCYTQLQRTGLRCIVHGREEKWAPNCGQNANWMVLQGKLRKLAGENNIKVYAIEERRLDSHDPDRRGTRDGLLWTKTLHCVSSKGVCLFHSGERAHPLPQWARASSFTRFLDHTQRRITVSRTPLDE